MKARLKGAQTGRNLLKKKSDALSMRFRQILRKIIEVSLKRIGCSPRIRVFLSALHSSPNEDFCSLFSRLRLRWER